MLNEGQEQQFITWFRNASPYIHAFRGQTFVVVFGGEAVAESHFHHLIHDIALLAALGVRLVLVHGARPQIEQRLRERGAAIRYVGGRRITDDVALACVKEAVGSTRMEIEARLSMGLANSPMAGARLRVVGGNAVIARPLGVRDGVDFCHSGAVRRIDADTLRQQLDSGALVLLSPLGYSPTGEIFNLTAVEVAAAAAMALCADKLICLIEGHGLMQDGQLLRELAPEEAEHALLHQPVTNPELHSTLQSAIAASRQGVRRVHLVDRRVNGVLLLELFTRDGCGTLISSARFEGTRPATIDDVGGILALIAPLEAEGVLVRRSRECLEMEISDYVVVERDGTIVAVGALHLFANESTAEIACLAVHPDYHGQGRGEALLRALEHQATQIGVGRVFVLTTQTAHWFVERGYAPAQVQDLPLARQSLYNAQRNSKVFIKEL